MRIFAVVLVIALAACGSEKSATIEADDGGKVTYSVDDDGEFSAELKSADGESGSIRTGKNVEVELPDGFSLYPGAEVVNNATMSSSESSGTMVLMTSTDTPEKVIAFYTRQAEDAGVKIETKVQSGPTNMIAGKREDGTALSVNATAQDDGTSIILTLGRELGG